MRVPRVAGRLTVALVVAVLVLAGMPGGSPPASAAITTSDLWARAIYYQQKGKSTTRDLVVSTIAKSSTVRGQSWADFLDDWGSISAGMKINSSTPSGLPTSGHAFVVLGSGLTSKGKMTSKLERRLKVALKALVAYPKSKVIVTGGKPRSGVTEAAAMKSWLKAKGIATSRIITESRSASTIGNARYTVDLLADQTSIKRYTLISDSSHLRLASVLFKAAKLRVEQKTGKKLDLEAVSAIAYFDLATAGKGALRQSSVDYAASCVASLLGVSTQHKALLSKAPTTPKLTSISLTAPKQVDYVVGAKLDRAGLVVTAVYSGSLSQKVTSSAKLTGFSSAVVGSGRAKVSYTAGSVTKSATFPYTVTKAKATLTAKLSATKLKVNKTKAKSSVTITSSTGIPVTGKVSFWVGTKKLKTISLSAADKGKVSYTYRAMTKTGKKTMIVKYEGSSTLTGATRSTAVTVVK